MKKNRSVKAILRVAAMISCALIVGSIRFLYGSGGAGYGWRAGGGLKACTSPARVCTGQSKNNCPAAGKKYYQVKTYPKSCNGYPTPNVSCTKKLQNCWRTVSCTWFSTPPFDSCGIDPFGKYGSWSSVSVPVQTNNVPKG